MTHLDAHPLPNAILLSWKAVGIPAQSRLSLGLFYEQRCGCSRVRCHCGYEMVLRVVQHIGGTFSLSRGDHQRQRVLMRARGEDSLRDWADRFTAGTPRTTSSLTRMSGLGIGGFWWYEDPEVMQRLF
jgi:hypothetical protein